jgi:hypothetical protein
MLAADPAERPTASMVLAHPWFRATGTVKYQIGKSSLQSMTSDTTATGEGRGDTTTSQSVEEGEASRVGLAFGTAYSKHQNYKRSAATSL